MDGNRYIRRNFVHWVFLLVAFILGEAYFIIVFSVPKQTNKQTKKKCDAPVRSYTKQPFSQPNTKLFLMMDDDRIIMCVVDRTTSAAHIHTHKFMGNFLPLVPCRSERSVVMGVVSKCGAVAKAQTFSFLS
ncbi:hypothetical protein, unlikely [Trypanosoma congolense IL3000]|uniref:Uncharacterized protein n=1 Tax=Trypanosoma congolense (strain IL3000) TaxID=1068625 RepID=F9WDG9_TRYCI|nr:hypothetical protein, unlikely [Trypanosoma congolense IL3000]